MEIIKDLKDFKPSGPVILTQGTFDGVHHGHRKILETVINKAKSQDGVSVLLTFYPHPRLVLYPDDNQLKLITTISEKASILEELGLDYLIIQPFTKELSRLSPYQYIKEILSESLSVSTLIIGYDHRFGKNREGSINEITKYSMEFGYEVEQIPEQDIDDCKVSSSQIRKALLSGDLELANNLLGRTFSMCGTVVDGNKVGTTIGFPTANIDLKDAYKLIPKEGVYAVQTVLDGNVLNGMLNIGNRPTFQRNERAIEVHLFDFSDNIYGRDVEILFRKRWRDEHKFENSTLLVEQLKKDEQEIRRYLQP